MEFPRDKNTYNMEDQFIIGNVCVCVERSNTTTP